MMTSTEVAQMFQAQNQMFSGQNAWAQQIGISGGASGVSGYGRPPTFTAAGATFPGMHGNTPFSYAPTGFGTAGYSSGNRFAAGAMSGMGAAATVAGAGVSTLGALGLLGRVGGAAVDPFSMFGVARGMGMGMGGAMGMAALPIAGAMAAGHVMSSFVHGGQQQAAINNTLGSTFGHFNPNSRSGSGFSRDDAQAIGSSIRQLAHIPEMMTSVKELTDLIPKLKQAGVMQGVKDVSEFQRRFKDAVGTIKDMSKILGTTMDEAAEFFAQSRGAGFIGKSAQLKNVLNAQFTSGVTGMSMGQVMGMQQAGAGMATQVGARRALGANAVTNMAQSIGLAQREGRISEGLLEDVTGLTGPEATQAAAQRYTEAMYNFSQRSPVGRLLMAGMAKFDENGKATGLDEKLVRQFQQGAISVDDLKRRAGNLTNDQKISFTHRNAGTLAMELAGKVGVQGTADIFAQLAGGKGTDADKMVMGRHTGLNESELDLAFELRGNQMGGGQGEFSQMSKFKAHEAALRERMSPDAIMRRIKTRIHNATTAGVEAAGAKVFTEIGKAYDSFIDDLVGRHVISLSKEGADKLAQAMAGGGGKELQSMFAAAHGMSGAASMTSSFASSFRNTGVASFLFRGDGDTGRSDASQAEHARRILGTTSAVDSDMVGRALNRGMAGTGSDALSATVKQMQANIGGFMGMDHQRKFDELKSSIMDKTLLTSTGIDTSDTAAIEKHAQMLESAGRGDEAMMLREGLAAQKSGFKGDFVAGIIARAQGESGDSILDIDFTKLGADGGTDFSNVESAKKALDAAESTLSGGFFGVGRMLEDDSIAMVKNSPEARKALMAAKGDKEVEKAIMSPGGAARLRKLGYNVTDAELEQLRKAHMEISKGGAEDQAKAYEALQTFQSARDSADQTVIRGAFTDAGKTLGASAADYKGPGGDALSAMAKAYSDFGSGSGSIDDVNNAGAALFKAIQGATGDDRDRLISAAGEYGDQAASVLNASKRFDPSKIRSRGDVTKAFGKMDDKLLDEVLKGVNVGDGLSKEELEKVQGRVFGARSAGVTAQAGQGKVATVEDRMLSTLQNLDKTMSIVATVIAKDSGDKDAITKADAASKNAYSEAQKPPGQ